MEEGIVKLAVVGCGPCGINHVRTTYGLLSKNLQYGFDVNSSAFERVKQVYPFTTNQKDILENSSINH